MRKTLVSGVAGSFLIVLFVVLLIILVDDSETGTNSNWRVATNDSCLHFKLREGGVVQDAIATVERRELIRAFWREIDMWISENWSDLKGVNFVDYTTVYFKNSSENSDRIVSFGCIVALYAEFDRPNSDQWKSDRWIRKRKRLQSLFPGLKTEPKIYLELLVVSEKFNIAVMPVFLWINDIPEEAISGWENNEESLDVAVLLTLSDISDAQGYQQVVKPMVFHIKDISIGDRFEGFPQPDGGNVNFFNLDDKQHPEQLLRGEQRKHLSLQPRQKVEVSIRMIFAPSSKRGQLQNYLQALTERFELRLSGKTP